MVKEQLRKLRTLNATPAMVEVARKDSPFTETTMERYWWRDNKEIEVEHKYKGMYGALLRCQQLGGGILKVAVFIPKDVKDGKLSARWEVFLNVGGREFITRYWAKGKEKWSESMLDNLPGEDGDRYFLWNYMNQRKYCAWINPQGAHTIRSLLKTDKTGWDGILEWQRAVRKEQRERKEMREVAPWDADMALMPRIPKRFMTWAGREMPENYIFYNTGESKGYCSYCRKEVPIMNPKHKKEDSCCKCGKPVVFLNNKKRSKYLETETAYCQIVQVVPGGLTVRIFAVTRNYRNREYWEPEIRMWEESRALITDGERRKYSKGMYKNKIYRWIPNSYYQRRCPIYAGNLRKLEETDAVVHSALPVLIREGIRVEVSIYLQKEQEYPVVESMVKIGMLRLVNDLIPEAFASGHYHAVSNCDGAVEFDLKKNELAKALCIDGSRLKRLREMNGNLESLMWLQEEKRENTFFPDEMIRYFSENNIGPLNFEFIRDKMSYLKIANYLKRQQVLMQEDVGQVLTTWRDYINMARKEKMQTDLEQIYKPKVLKVAHDELVEMGERKNIKKQADDVRKQYKNLEKYISELVKYEYAADGFAIVAPRCTEDIVKEGILLKHCIHRCEYYFDRMNRKETFILFLRKEGMESSPWYTLEVEPGGNIRQKRTLGDNQNADFKIAVKFLKKWQKEIQKRLSEEDMELAKRSDEARKKNYAELRKNGNLVWHGKLAGKLLADVLEDDFMAAGM